MDEHASFIQHVEMAKATNAARTLINAQSEFANPDYVEALVLQQFQDYKGKMKLTYESIIG